MTLKDARQLRDYVGSKCTVNCTVPLGFGPDGYFAVTVLRTGPHKWQSRAEFRTWLAGNIRERREITRRYDEMIRRKNMPKARNPIELMIDRACGLA